MAGGELEKNHQLFHSVEVKAFPRGSDGKEATCNVEDPGLISGLGRIPREGNGYPLQCSCLENPMDRGALWAIMHGVAESGTTEQTFTTIVTNGKGYDWVKCPTVSSLFLFGRGRSSFLHMDFL